MKDLAWLRAQVLPETVIDVWKGNANWPSEMANVTKAGHKAILASCWYLNVISYGNDWPKVYTFNKKY